MNEALHGEAPAVIGTALAKLNIYALPTKMIDTQSQWLHAWQHPITTSLEASLLHSRMSITTGQ